MSGIYIHIPFCKQACYYCDFHFSVSLKRKSELVAALAEELVLRKNEINQTVKTIYFGGGTPSLLTIDELQFLIDTIYDNYQVSDNPEITIEANPDDLTNDLIIQLSKSPINRLSIGIQSFFEEDLKLMNRVHSAEEAKACLSKATQYFDNISLDLIYGIPGMTNERWKKNIEIALSYRIPHISTYALTVEPKTALYKFIKTGKISPVDEIVSKDHYLILLDKMKNAGYINYEFSNFSKEGYFSINNTAYWQGKSYLGIGPSAHSFNGITRSWNIKSNLKYSKSIKNGELPQESETLSISDKFNEYIMTGLRTMWGVSLDKVEKDFGKKYLDYLILEAKKPIEDDFLEIVIVTPKIRGKQSTKENEITSSSRPDVSGCGTPRKDRILRITKTSKFLCDGIASNLFWVD